jgi:hypothetical protein
MVFGLIAGGYNYLQVKRDYISVATESNIAQQTLKYTAPTQIFGIN